MTEDNNPPWDRELKCINCEAKEIPGSDVTIELVGELNEPVCSICLEESGNKSVYGGP